MAIRYSVGKMKHSLGTYANTTRYRGNLQIAETFSLDQFAEHMSNHDCKYNKGDIYAVLTMAIRCIKELAMDSKAVELGDLGTFLPKITNCKNGTAQATDFTAENIVKVTLKFKNSVKTKNFRPECSFENVSLRANQALLRSAEKNNQSSMELYAPDTPQGGGGGGTGGGNEQEGE
ncbi:MAG: hypothetical protein MJY95_00845 [Bacteroidaceae bacterium]|nr:hypothetical protein [Bacteroidaceae bacterium]